ncbi:MAG: glucosamine-6-phosphate deaminase [Clostridiales bacterium]|nr:glucosamine-6-phosphate deaminase [Clostridiales bacterium]
MSIIKELIVDKLKVKVYSSREEMGKGSANDVGPKIKELLNEREEINMLFAAAPSQSDFIASLLADKDIDWGRINAFHMDEYIGLSDDAPQRFGNYLKENIFDKVSFKAIYYINGNVEDPEAECERYTNLLKENPIDIACMGIGENGHIAFNDPHVAFFDDEKWVKVVDLDMACRTQQVNDGCFDRIDDVPTHAITLTIPALMAAEYAYCIVPAPSKANAIRDTVEGPITEDCPATILRRHDRAILYADPDSAKYII